MAYRAALIYSHHVSIVSFELYLHPNVAMNGDEYQKTSRMTTEGKLIFHTHLLALSTALVYRST